MDVHEEVILLVLHRDDGLIAFLLTARHHQFRTHVAVGMGHAQCRLVETVTTKSRIGIAVQTSGIIDLMRLFWLDARAIILNTWCLTLVHSEHQRCFGCVHKYILGTGSCA